MELQLVVAVQSVIKQGPERTKARILLRFKNIPSHVRFDSLRAPLVAL